MNPLKFRMPKQGQTYPDAQLPRPSELPAWLEAQPPVSLQSAAPLLAILQKYNRCQTPPAARLKTLILLKPSINEVLKLLRGKYQNESLPLGPKASEHANLCLQFLEEVSFGYKIVVTDIVTDKIEEDIGVNLFIAALRLTIDHLGELLLECYSQYSPLPKGLWGELHRLYHLAEHKDLHNRILAEEGKEPDPLATIKQAYLRLALLALTEPNHLVPGQVTTIYNYLEKWVAGCRMIEKTNTVAEAGDIVIDLADERPPALATGYARFRPVVGRFLDIAPLKSQLEKVLNSQEEKHKENLRGGVSPTIAERLQRDLLVRLNKTWQGRAERETERRDDGKAQVSLCVGLDAAHHFINEEKAFHPERDETYIHRPEKKRIAEEKLSLLGTDETPWNLDEPTTINSDGLDQTRVSRFGEEVDVWNTVQQTHVHARSKREAAMSHFQMGPWLRINQSSGGLSLRRLPDTPSRIRVGTLVAYLDHTATKIWKIGILRWLQDEHGKNFDIGLMTIAHMGIPVAVRAIGGAGAGGEYFRSLMVRSVLSEGNTPGMLVPASIYDIGTQLVLNLQTEIKYVRLTRMVETTGSFSLFEYKDIVVPPAEQVRIDALGREDSTT